MSPTSVCYTVTKMEAGEFGGRGLAPPSVTQQAASSFQFGIRKQEKVSLSSTPLKVCKDSHRIRKPPLPLPQVQYRPPIIIHTYSPKVIHTEPHDFMSLVQKLTGSSDTRLRRKRFPSKKEKPRAGTDDRGTGSTGSDQSDVDESLHTVTDLKRQGSTTAHCAASPSSSEDSVFLASDVCGGGDSSIKQSNSPRGPLSNFEFDNHDLMFGAFDGASGNLFSQVKTEPMFSISDSSFNFFTEFSQPAASSGSKASKLPPLPKPQNVQESYSSFHSPSIDINSLPSRGFLSPGLMAGLPDLSPGGSATTWSHSFLDSCFTAAAGAAAAAAAPSSHFVHQAPLQRQRFLGGYTPPSSEGSTMVALENIQAFMLT